MPLPYYRPGKKECPILRSISDFEINFAPDTGFTIEREFEKWFPRLPSFGISWTF